MQREVKCAPGLQVQDQIMNRVQGIVFKVNVRWAFLMLQGLQESHVGLLGEFECDEMYLEWSLNALKLLAS